MCMYIYIYTRILGLWAGPHVYVPRNRPRGTPPPACHIHTNVYLGLALGH